MIRKHIPVMMKEAIEALNIRDNLDYIDATFGGGGYSEEILKRADCKLLSIDKDPTVKNYANKLKIKYKKKFTFVNDDFENLESIIKENNKPLVVEISFGFNPPFYNNCIGYWEKSLKFHSGKFNPYAWMVDNLLDKINEK